MKLSPPPPPPPLRFALDGPATVHGFAGYFDAELYGAGPDAVVISIAPHNFSTGMFSWFPLYFPLRAPLHVPARPDGAGGGAAASTALDVHLWRCASPSKVWYEWAAALPQTRAMTPIHNPNGRSYWIGL